MKTAIETLNAGPATARPYGRTDGQTVDRVDQLSSVVLLGLAVAGSVAALGVLALIH